MLASPSQAAVVEALRGQLRQEELARRSAAACFSSGCRALDEALPKRAFERGRLIEYLAAEGSGAVALAIVAAREACRESGAFVVIDHRRSFYPPGAASLGFDSQTIFVRPRTPQDQLWALNQALRCPGIGAVLCWPEKLNDREFRSLQLAAEAGGSVGLFMRPVGVRGHPTWSELQLLVEALPADRAVRRLRIEVVRCRNGNAGASVEVELDDETGMLPTPLAVSVAPAMAVAAGAQRSPAA